MSEQTALTPVVVGGRGAPPPPEVVEADYPDAPSTSLRDHLRVLWRRRGLAAACFLATVALALLVTLLLPREYTATTRLQVTRQSPIQLRLEENVVRVDEDERIVNGASTYVGTQVATLQSRDLAERVIRAQQLDRHPAFLEPGPSQPAPEPVMSAPAMLDAAPPDPTRPAWATAPPVDPKLVDRYGRWLTVRDVRGTDLIELTLTTPSPTLSAFLAAAHTHAYLEVNEEARMATRATAQRFLDRQLREAETQVEAAEAALNAFASEHPNVAVNEEQKVAGQRIAELATLATDRKSVV